MAISLGLILGTGFITGAMIGSLTKALADRGLGTHTFWGRSYCPKCKHTLSWFDLFPILSYLLLRGRCRYCHKKISLEYPAVEFVLGILFAILFYLFVKPDIYNLNDFLSLVIPLSETFFAGFVITILSVVFLTDIKKMLIPDRIVLPAIVIALFYLTSLTLYKIVYIYVSLANHTVGQYLLPPYNDYYRRHLLIAVEPLIGSILTGFALGLFFLFLIIITRGRGMGGGDFKLAVFIGLAFGFPQAVSVIVLSFLLGAVVGLALIIIGKKKLKQTIPFGPFLSVAGVLTIFWGQQIFDWYLQLF